MRQMVDAAMKMHALGIFHRDLKMENILLECSSDVPRVRILDFGCSCIDSRKPFSSYSGISFIHLCRRCQAVSHPLFLCVR